MREDIGGFEKFLVDFKKELLDSDLSLFCEIDAERESGASYEGADGIIAIYDKFSKDSIPSFNDGEKRCFTSLTDNIEPSKIYMDLSSFAYSGGEPITRERAFDLAYGSGKEISKNDASGTMSFARNIYHGGKSSSEEVRLESLENLLRKLELLSELGLMGISFDIMRVPTEYLMAYSELFSTPPKNLI